MSPSAIFNGDLAAVKVIQLSYDPADSDASARKLIFALRPEWESSPGNLEFVRFSDGITNTLFKAIKQRPGQSELQNDQDAVLLRAYGSGTEILIDREREALSHVLLARNSLAPPLLARFNNGLLYTFIPGKPCAPEDFRDPKIYPSIARKLGQWHSVMPVGELVEPSVVDGPEFNEIRQLLPGKPLPNIWTNMLKWIMALPNNTEAEKERNATLHGELLYSTALLSNARGLDSGEYVATHNDLLSGNVIILPRSKASSSLDVAFIDYEYTIPGPPAFDVANHFAEWTGFSCDFNVIPTCSERREFIENYVSSYRSFAHKVNGKANGNGHTSGEASQADVDKFMEEVDTFRGIPGLYWGIWGLIQNLISDIDFDYATYADTRLSEYWAWKAELDGSRAKKGEEKPLRERRWAQASP